jgi:hypothetical protein
MEFLDVISVWGIREPFGMLSHAVGALVTLGATAALVRHARRWAFDVDTRPCVTRSSALVA